MHMILSISTFVGLYLYAVFFRRQSRNSVCFATYRSKFFYHRSMSKKICYMDFMYLILSYISYATKNLLHGFYVSSSFLCYTNLLQGFYVSYSILSVLCYISLYIPYLKCSISLYEHVI